MCPDCKNPNGDFMEGTQPGTTLSITVTYQGLGWASCRDHRDYNLYFLHFYFHFLDELLPPEVFFLLCSSFFFFFWLSAFVQKGGSCVRPSTHPRWWWCSDFANGDMICRDCGLVVGDRIVDVRSEWRNFADSGDDPSRASRVNDYLPSGGLATEIAKLPTGPNGQNNNGQGGAGGGKMSQWQRRIQLSQGDQNLLSGFDKITHIAEILVLPQKIKVHLRLQHTLTLSPCACHMDACSSACFNLD
jgi:hypothetical protein